jgi:uncharacterized membrane protein YgcG
MLESRSGRAGSTSVAPYPRCVRRGVVVAIIAFISAVFMGLPPGDAMAEEPFRMEAQIEDRAGVLEDRAAELEAALSALEAERGIRLWVAFVRSFSDIGGQQWAYQTALDTGLGLDDVLLAVATEDQTFSYSIDEQFKLGTSRMNQIMTEVVEPVFAGEDWAGGAIAAAEGTMFGLSPPWVKMPWMRSSGRMCWRMAARFM